MTKARGWLAILACAALASCAEMDRGDNGTRATLFVAPDSTPEVRYSLAPGESEIRFVEHDRAATFARSHFWSFDRNCFVVEDDALRRLAPSCGDPVVRIDWDAGFHDRMYPALIRLRNGGLLVFTGYLQPLALDGKRTASWRALAPPGGTAQYLEQSGPSVVVDGLLSSDDADGWIYLGPDRFMSNPFARVLVDDGVSPRIADEMLRVAPLFLSIYGDRLGARLRARPIFYLTWLDREAPGHSFEADVVAGPVAKFTLYGRDWKDPSRDSIESFRSTEAHELAHFWNRSRTKTAPWVVEGGAEVLSWGVLHAAGLFDDRALVDRVDNAFDECAILSGGKGWPAIAGRDRGRYPYACGAVMQLALIAVARREDPPMDAFSLWREMLADGWPSDEVSLKALLRRISPKAAESLGALLNTNSPFASTLEDTFRNAGVRAYAVVPETAGRMLKFTIAKSTLMALMVHDCGGNGAFHSDAHELVTYAIRGCRSFHGGMRIASLEGSPFLERPIEALQRARSACTELRQVDLITEDHRELHVACDASTPLPPLDTLRHFDAAQVAQLLDSAPR